MPERIENLRIWTSNSTESRFNELVENNILPIIIIGITKNSPLFRWRNTMIHFLDLGPDPELWNEYREKKITREEFKDRYLKNLWKNGDVFHTLSQLEILTHLARSKGVCILCGISENIKDDPTREVIAEYFNNLRMLKNEVTEWNPLKDY